MTLDDIIATDRTLARLRKARDAASERRFRLPAGSSRARVTTANAKWSIKCEAYDRREREIRAAWEVASR